MSTPTPPPEPGQEPPEDARPSQPPPPPGAEAAGPGAGGAAAIDAPGLGVRFGARIIDAIIVGVVGAILAALFGTGGAFDAVGNTVTTLLLFAYFVALEGTSGQTLGKRLLRLRVERGDGSPMDPAAAARRNWWQLLGLLAFVPFLGILASLASLAIVIWIAVTISRGADNRGVHDEWGQTQVVRAA